MRSFTRDYELLVLKGNFSSASYPYYPHHPWVFDPDFVFLDVTMTDCTY